MKEINKNIIEYMTDDKFNSAIFFNPEIGTFIKDFMKIGISYLHIKAHEEYTYEEINGMTFNYTAYLRGKAAELKFKYYVLNKKKVKGIISCGILWGLYEFLYDDFSYSKYTEREEWDFDSFYSQGKRGLGFSTYLGFDFYPLCFMCIGIDSGYKHLNPQKVVYKNVDPFFHESVKKLELNISSFFFAIKIGFQI